MMHPSGWEQTTLGSIAKWGSGGTPSRSNPLYYGGDIPWIKTGDLGPRLLKIVPEYITELGLSNSSAKLFPRGSIGLAMYGATIGKVSIFDIDAACNQACAVAQPNEKKVDRDFLYFLLRGEKEAFIAKGKGGAQPNISQKVIKEHQIFLPTLDEQRKIVEKLDCVLERVERAQSRLEKVPLLLKRFRMSVLSAAVSGELTEEWRDANNADDWEHVSLKQVGKGFNYGSSAKSKKEGLVPVLRMGNLQDSKLDWSDLVFTSDEKEIEKYKLEPGDVLFNRTNSPELVGKTSIYRGEREAIFAGYLIKVQGTERLSTEYLNIQLNSPHARDYCWQVKTDGVSQSNINAQKLKAYEFNLPSVEEQEEIVRVVSELLAKSDLVKKQYEIAKLRVDKLTQSILARAFRGELFEPFTDKADRDAQPQSADVTDEQSTAVEETSLDQLDKSPTQPQPTSKSVNDKSELLAQLKSVKKAMTAQQLFDSASVETFKAIDELFVELKHLLEFGLIEKVGEGENCKFKATK
ncbi:TPA: restriction endonuclease subunit S [Vibrio alginolyticus]